MGGERVGGERRAGKERGGRRRKKARRGRFMIHMTQFNAHPCPTHISLNMGVCWYQASISFSSACDWVLPGNGIT